MGFFWTTDWQEINFISPQKFSWKLLAANNLWKVANYFYGNYTTRYLSWKSAFLSALHHYLSIIQLRQMRTLQITDKNNLVVGEIFEVSILSNHTSILFNPQRRWKRNNFAFSKPATTDFDRSWLSSSLDLKIYVWHFSSATRSFFLNKAATAACSEWKLCHTHSEIHSK